MKISPLFLAAMLSLLLVACSEETVPVSYSGLNNTDKSIVSIIVNGEGGVLDAPANGGGAHVCCVIIPKKWRPDLKVNIKWQEDGDWLLDENGMEVIRKGKRVYVPAPWKERTVDIPEYKTMGVFYIVFFPNDEVKVAVSNGYPDVAGISSKN